MNDKHNFESYFKGFMYSRGYHGFIFVTEDPNNLSDQDQQLLY